MRASAFVGRVGGLAVALGIGAAAFGAAAPAWADSTADTAGTTTTSDAASTPTAATPAGTQAAAPRSRSARTAGARRPGEANPSAASATRKNAAPALPAGVAAPAPAIPSHPADPTPARSAAAVETDTNPVAAQSDTAEASTSDITDAVDNAPDAPVMTPPSAVAPVSGAADAVLGTLLGTNPGAPVEAPLSWVVLAVSRRPSDPTPSAPSAAVASNSSPVISGIALSSPNAVTGAVTGTVSATDPNGDTMTYKATTSGTKGAVTITSNGVFTYTPTATARHSAAKAGATTAVTTDTVTVTVTDSKGLATSKAVTVTVTPKNAVPVTTKTVSTPNSSTGVVTGSVTATDADKDTLSYTAGTKPAKGTVTVNATTGAFTYTPTATARHAAAKTGATTAVTTDTFTVTVTDGYGGSVAVPVTVTISPKNTAPVAGTTTVGTPNTSTGVVTGTVTATDAERDSLTYSAPVTTAKGAVTINASTGAFTYTPSTPSRGSATTATTDTFTVTVTDGYGGSTPIAVSVPVNPQGSTPTTAKITYVFNYTTGSQYWTPEAKAALQSSADQVAAYIVVSQPVTLTFDVTALNDPNSNTMASTGSDLTSSRAGFYNTVVQNKILTGVDSNGSAADGTIDVNFGTGYALGDTVSATQYDFKSTMMHEMLHAYGFLAYVDEAGWNKGTNWTKFDSFIGTSSGTKVISANGYKFNTLYNTNLTGGGGGLYFLGPAAVAAYGGPVPLYTPNPWEAGSSVSHLDDNTFTGTRMQLMNAMAETGPGIRTLSAVELGVLTDLGYTVKQNPAAASMLFVGLIFLRRRRNPETQKRR